MRIDEPPAKLQKSTKAGDARAAGRRLLRRSDTKERRAAGGAAIAHQTLQPPDTDVHRSELTRLLALWPWEIADTTLQGRARLLNRLRRALRVERQCGIAGNWTYDLTRHARLLAAYRTEVSCFNARLRAAGAGIGSTA